MKSIKSWIKTVFYCMKITKDLLKGVKNNMVLPKDHPLVKSALLLLGAGVYEDINDVPNIFNLREMVQLALMGE